MSAFAATFNHVDRLYPAGQNMPVLFTGYAGEDFSLATSIWQPAATARVTLTVGLSLAAYKPTNITLALRKNGQTIGAIATLDNTLPVTLAFVINDTCQARQRRDSTGSLLFDSTGMPLYDTASFDSYQVRLTSAAKLHIFGSLLSYFTGRTIASAG